MTIRSLNSVGGFSVGSNPQTEIILANGDIVTTNITANGIIDFSTTSNVSLGNISNVHITGGSTNQFLQTDGNGNLSFVTLGSLDSAAPMPYFIPNGQTSTVPINYQGLFSQTITIDGVFEVNGVLIQVTDTVEASNNQVLYSDNGTPTGNTGFTFQSYSGNLYTPGNIIATGNLLPNANITYDLGEPTQRWKDLWLSNSTIYIGNSTISTDGNNLVLTNSGGGELIVAGNSTVTSIENGSSNITINANGNVITSVAGNVGIFTVTGTGANIFGTLSVTGNTKAQAVQTDNYQYANGVPISFTGEPVGPNLSLQFNNNNDFDGSANLTFNPGTNLLSLTGNLSVTGNISLASNSAINIGGNTGVAGQVLTSDGTNTYWSTRFYYGPTPPNFATLNYGDIFFYIDNPNSFQRLYMWVTDGSSDYFYDFLPPSF